MRITVINPDNYMVIDGDKLKFESSLGLDSSIWAIQWYGTKGEVEFADGSPNQEITSFADYQFLVDAFNAEKLRQAEAEAEAQANLTYDVKRAMSYPSVEEQMDMMYWDSINGTTTWKDAIEVVKNAYPKV